MREDSPLALSVEKVRHEMLRGILVPRDMVNKSLEKVYEKLWAKESKFFSFKGTVTDQRDVDAHGIQLQAADTILSIAGLHNRDSAGAVGPPSVTMEIDSKTGIMRLVVGQTALPASEPSAAERPVEHPDQLQLAFNKQETLSSILASLDDD